MRRSVLLLAAALLASAAPARAELKERIAAVVNGQPIALSEVEDRIQVELARLANAPMTAEQRRQQRQELLRRGLDQLIDEKLVEAEAGALGIEVSEDEIQKQIETLAKQNGLDVTAFLEAVKAQGIDPETVRDSVRRQSLQYRLLQYKVKPRKISDEEVAAAYSARNANPDYELRVRHLFIPHPANANTSEVLAAQAKADQALRRLKAGEEFAVIARDLSDGPSAKEGGDLGWVRPGLLFPEADRVLFGLKPGEITPLLHTETGFHLFKVEDRHAIPPKPLAEVQEELRNRLSNESVYKEREDYLKSLRKTAQIDAKL